MRLFAAVLFIGLAAATAVVVVRTPGQELEKRAADVAVINAPDHELEKRLDPLLWLACTAFYLGCMARCQAFKTEGVRLPCIGTCIDVWIRTTEYAENQPDPGDPGFALKKRLHQIEARWNEFNDLPEGIETPVIVPRDAVHYGIVKECDEDFSRCYSNIVINFGPKPTEKNEKQWDTALNYCGAKFHTCQIESGYEKYNACPAP